MKPNCCTKIGKLLIISVLIIILPGCFSTWKIKAQGVKGQVSAIDPQTIEVSTPAPLFRDPIYDGVADPVLVWNPIKKVWSMFYTQRRAKLDLPGVEWCHGSEIGVAESDDFGFKKPDGKWRMWYKDEGNGSKTFAVESSDLENWKPVEDPGISKLYGEGPKTFRFKDHYWLIKDPNSGLDVYRSDDLETWTYQGKILDKPGTRNSDGTIGKHADVVVCGEKAYIIYFTHPYSEKAPAQNCISPFSNRHTALQAAELEVLDGKLFCDRDKPFRIRLDPPK